MKIAIYLSVVKISDIFFDDFHPDSSRLDRSDVLTCSSWSWTYAPSKMSLDG